MLCLRWPDPVILTEVLQMRFLVAILLLVGVTTRASSQAAPLFRNLDEGMRFLEDRVVGRQAPMTDPATVRALLEIVNKADTILAQGQVQDPAQVVPVVGPTAGGSFQLMTVPRTVVSRGCGRRCHAVAICESMWV